MRGAPVRRAGDLRSFRLGDVDVVWHRGRLHQLEGPAAEIWRLTDGVRTPSDISAVLVQQFDVDARIVQRDVDRFLQSLADEGLLVPGADPTPVVRSPFSLRSSPYIGPGRVPLGSGTDAEWVDDAPTYSALGRRFTVVTTDPILASRLRRTLRSMHTANGSADQRYAVIQTDDGYEIYLDGRGLNTSPSQDQALRHVLWHVNSEVIRTSTGHVLIHGAAAVSEVGAVVLPGSMNAGKTTLVTGLALAGFPVLTDELVAVRLGTGTIDAYPRPFNIGGGSWPALPEIAGSGEVTCSADGVPELLHLAPDDIPRAQVADHADAALLVIPQFEEGAAVMMRPVGPAEALRAIVEQAMNLDAHGDAGFTTLVELVRRCPAYTLRQGSLRDAVEAIRSVVV